MINSAWCVLNSRGDTLKLHDIFHNPRSKCQKQFAFTPRQFQLEGRGFENTTKIFFKGTEKMWNNFIKPGLKVATPIISAGVTAKTKNPQSAQITRNLSKSLTGGKILSVTDMHGHGLRMKVI